MTTATTTPAMFRTRRASRRASPRTRRWRATPLLVLTVLVALAGATVIAYSPTAKWFSQLNQAAVVERYRSDVDHARPSARTQLRRAQRYNDALSAGALLAANANVPTGDGQSTDDGLDYWKMLTTTSGMMARIQIPAIHVDLPIYHGTSQATLRKGAGHLQGTSLPIGGADTHSVITAHRGLPEATLFTDLDKLHKGDRFTISTFGEVLTYEIFDTKVVDPEDTAALRQEEGKDLVTLVTCTPLGINSHRMLVTGKRVKPTPPADLAASRAGPPDAGFPWFVVAYGAALLAIALYAWWAGRVPVATAAATPTASVAAAPGVPGGRSRRRRWLPSPLAPVRALRRAGRSLAARVRRGGPDRAAAVLALPQPGSDLSGMGESGGPDALTGLCSRAGLLAALHGPTHSAQRDGVALLFVRLDDLPGINVRSGRTAGDAALTEVADRLGAAIEDRDLRARVSAATFVVLRARPDGAASWAARIVASLPDAGGDAAAPGRSSVLVTTDGFHHDAAALLRDAEGAARPRLEARASDLQEVHLTMGVEALEALEAVGGLESSLLEDAAEVGRPSAGSDAASSAPSERDVASEVPPTAAASIAGPVDAEAWLDLSDDDYLATLRTVRRTSGPTADRGDRST